MNWPMPPTGVLTHYLGMIWWNKGIFIMAEVITLVRLGRVPEGLWKAGQRELKFTLPICGTADWDQIVINTGLKIFKIDQLMMVGV